MTNPTIIPTMTPIATAINNPEMDDIIRFDWRNEDSSGFSSQVGPRNMKSMWPFYFYRAGEGALPLGPPDPLLEEWCLDFINNILSFTVIRYSPSGKFSSVSTILSVLREETTKMFPFNIHSYLVVTEAFCFAWILINLFCRKIDVMQIKRRQKSRLFYLWCNLILFPPIDDFCMLGRRSQSCDYT